MTERLNGITLGSRYKSKRGAETSYTGSKDKHRANLSFPDARLSRIVLRVLPNTLWCLEGAMHLVHVTVAYGHGDDCVGGRPIRGAYMATGLDVGWNACLVVHLVDAAG